MLLLNASRKWSVLTLESQFSLNCWRTRKAAAMRIYLSVDLEGVHGVVHSIHTQPGERAYETAVRWMHEEVNTVAEAAFESGATEVFINDSHWDMKNLNPDLLH